MEEALGSATGFHNSLQDFINWLTQAEQTLNMSSPPSLILDTVLFQIDEHKVCRVLFYKSLLRVNIDDYGLLLLLTTFHSNIPKSI